MFLTGQFTGNGGGCICKTKPIAGSRRGQGDDVVCTSPVFAISKEKTGRREHAGRPDKPVCKMQML